jgi:hypothetical protein
MAKATTMSLLNGFPKRVQKARVRAEKLIGSALKQAVEALPSRPKKAFKDVTAQIEKATTDLQKRQTRALKEVTARGERLVATVEKRAVAVVKPLVARLDVASRSDVERLSKRVSLLERRVGPKARQSVAA